MSIKTISNASISINNELLVVVPNSVTIVMGAGEVTVRSGSVGAGASESVHSENAENKIGKFKIDLYTTKENAERVLTLSENIGKNVIQAIDGFDSFTLINCSLVNDPEVQLTADGVFTFEFEGDRVLTS